MKVTGSTIYGFYEESNEQKRIEVRSFAPAYGFTKILFVVAVMVAWHLSFVTMVFCLRKMM